MESPSLAAAKRKAHLQAFRPQNDSRLQNAILLGDSERLQHSLFRILHGRLSGLPDL
jgi:hypothetical protein